MCMGGSPSSSASPPPAPPAPPPAPAAPAVAMASASDNATSDVAKLARQKGRAALRIDQTSNVLATAGEASGLNIPS